jgi:hypothetical protein
MNTKILLLRNGPIGTPTPVNVKKFSQLLSGYDQIKKQSLIQGFSEGFKIPVRNNIKPVQAKNHLSAQQQSLCVDADIACEITAGRIAGPFNSTPLPNLFVSPIGMVPKKEPGAYRRIHDLSFPPGESVNDAIPRELCTVQYESLQDINSFVGLS